MEKTSFDDTTMAEFLARHDLIYEKPALEYGRGLPLGNATASAVIWGDNPLKISLDRADFWEIRNTFKPDPEKFKWRRFREKVAQGRGDEFEEFCNLAPGPMPNRFPLGRLELSLKGKSVSDCTMRLHLHEAMAEGACRTECGGLVWQAYVSAEQPVLIFRYRELEDETLRLRVRLSTEAGAYTDDIAAEQAKGTFGGIGGYACSGEVAEIVKGWGWPASVRGRDGDIEFYRQIVPENGSVGVAWRCLRQDGRETTLAVGMIVDRKSDGAAEQAVELLKGLAAPDALTKLEQAHQKWWRDFYPKSFLSLPDTRLEGFYWIQMYLLGCMARPDGITPSIGGVWPGLDNGWSQMCGNDYHWNLNNQGILMPIYTANRLELGFSTYDLLERARPTMAEFCRTFFECDGEFLPHCTDIDGRPTYCNPDQFEFCGLPWMCQQMWLHYRHSLDREFLRTRLYPMMRQAVRPMLNDLRPDDNGKLHLPCTSSPEYHGKEETFHFALNFLNWKKRFGPDASIDLAFLRFLCQTLLETVNILEIKDEDEPVWQNTLDHLTDYPVDEYGGLMVRRDVPAESSHRHLSHLFAIHPLHLLRMEAPEEKALIEKSLLVLAANGTGEWMGWSFAQAAMLYILAGRPAVARMLLLDLIDKVLYENTFYLQGCNHDCAVNLQHNMGVTVEAGEMGAAALMDFLCRSYHGTVYVCDQMPAAWDEASFWHLRAEGAFLVSARRKNGRSEFIALFSEQGGPARLASDLGTDVDVWCDNRAVPYRAEAGRIEFDTEAGNEYVVCPRGCRPADYRIAPVREKSWERNFFGLKKHERY